MILVLKRSKNILLLEMGCAYGSLLEEREVEKRNKYEELAADLSGQCRGYRLRTVPIVIGDLGSIGGLAKSLESIKIFTQKELSTILSSMQTRVLYGSTRILKRHLAG